MVVALIEFDCAKRWKREIDLCFFFQYGLTLCVEVIKTPGRKARIEKKQLKHHRIETGWRYMDNAFQYLMFHFQKKIKEINDHYWYNPAN